MYDRSIETRGFNSEVTVKTVLSKRFGNRGSRIAKRVCGHVRSAKLPSQTTEEVLGDLAYLYGEMDETNIISLNAYCWQVATNQVAKAINKKTRDSKRRTVSLQDLGNEEALACEGEACELEQEEEEARKTQILGLLKTLSEEDRRLVCLHYLESKSFKTIEKMTGIASSTCHARVSKAMHCLRQRVRSVA